MSILFTVFVHGNYHKIIHKGFMLSMNINTIFQGRNIKQKPQNLFKVHFQNAQLPQQQQQQQYSQRNYEENLMKYFII